MGIEEGTFWDEHWVLYGNQFVNKLHIKKKKQSKNAVLEEEGSTWKQGQRADTE